MNKVKLNLSIIIISIASLGWGEVISPDSTLLEQQRKIEKDMEQVIQTRILDPMLGLDRAGVVVHVELEIKKQVTKRSAQKKKQKEKSKFAEKEFILPGLPTPKSITGGDRPKEKTSEESETQEIQFNYIFAIKRRVITVIYDMRIKDELIKLVETTIWESFSMKKGDKLEFKKARFKGYLNKLTQPFILLPLIFAILLFLFLFGPLAGFFRSLIRTMRDKGGTEVSVDSKFENASKEGEGEGGGGGTQNSEDLTHTVYTSSPPLPTPFRYIDEGNLKRLVYLLRKEPPKIIALVLSYIKPELVREVLNILPPELQAQVAVNMATIRQMTEAEVTKIDKEIKEKIDYLVGGLDNLLQVLDEVDIDTKNNIMEYLEQEKPELYEMVKKATLSFDDIPNFPDQALQTILRELKTESFARAMRNAPQEVFNKIFNNMSSGASALLKEEMEYGRPLTQEQIEDERKKVLDIIKTLERDGKIVIREREKHTMLQGEEEIQSSDWEGIADSAVGPSRVSSQELYEYFQAGVSMHEEGRYDDALAYFNYCIQADPSMWQAHQYRGITQYSLGRPDDALASLQKALQINPQDPGIREWIESLKQAV